MIKDSLLACYELLRFITMKFHLPLEYKTLYLDKCQTAIVWVNKGFKAVSTLKSDLITDRVQDQGT